MEGGHCCSLRGTISPKMLSGSQMVTIGNRLLPISRSKTCGCCAKNFASPDYLG